MAVIKCKMCGGDLDISEGLTVCECEYCGSKQTVPSADNEKKLTLFGRANRLRLANEFDKAAGVYESIVADFPEEAEAYWGLVLCRYGIEYVDDPASGKKIPTCHRSSFESVMEDADFEQACENADGVARRQYRDEAKQIEELRKGIIEVSGKEAPYDIFICYKETDENGDRTLDSVLAQDVYDALTGKGYRVFFSRISLEDKLGTEYEPYIFAALNSAKVMLAFGTDYEYYNAVWVKNEWSRFLKLMASDKSKHLIPCYRGIDAYDMPKEFAKLQAQDMGKVGAMQDLLRGIEKLLPKEQAASTAQPVVQQVVQQVVQGGGPNVDALLKRGNMALEDREWDKAEKFFDAVLNVNPECAEAYLGLAMSKYECHNWKAFAGSYVRPDSELYRDKNAERARKFGSDEMRAWLDGLDAERTERERREAAERAERARKETAERVERERKETAERAERERKKAEECSKRIEWNSLTFHMIAAGWSRTIGLKADGTVVAAGSNIDGRCDVGGWKDIVAIAAGFSCTVGLRLDRTVLAVGSNKEGQCNVSGWADIVAIAAGNNHTVGLKADGTVVAVGRNDEGQCDVGGWRDVVAIAAGGFHTMGLKADGTIVAVGSNRFGQCNAGGWMDIVAIAAGEFQTVGLKVDGTVIAAGRNEEGQCNVGGWTDIVAIAAGSSHTIGLKADGTVIATKLIKNIISVNNGQCDVNDWTDVVAIAAGAHHTVGLKADGTVVATWIIKSEFVSDFGQSDVGRWKLFNSVETIKQERIDAMTVEQSSLRTELANLKGLFSAKRRREIEGCLAGIENELNKLKG